MLKVLRPRHNSKNISRQVHNPADWQASLNLASTYWISSISMRCRCISFTMEAFKFKTSQGLDNFSSCFLKTCGDNKDFKYGHGYILLWTIELLTLDISKSNAYSAVCMNTGTERMLINVFLFSLLLCFFVMLHLRIKHSRSIYHF